MSTEIEETLGGCGSDLMRWDKLVKAMSTVCYISIMNKPESTPVRKGCGTLVQRIVHGKKITAILTDSQVICSKEMAEKSVATFTSDGTDERTMVVQLYPDIFFLSNEEYDFTLVGIKEEDINSLCSKLAIQPLQLKRISHRDVYNVKTVQIAQYGEGESKWLSTGRVYEIQAKYILYNADTIGSCSGSPVFYACNEDCYINIIAMHKADGIKGASSTKESLGKAKGVFINHIFDRLYGDPVQLLQPESKPVFSPQEISRIGRRLSNNWEKVALTTGKFDLEEINNIRKNPNHEDNVLKAIAMLGDYQKRRGTKEDLASALKEFGEFDLAEKVHVDYFQTHAN